MVERLPGMRQFRVRIPAATESVNQEVTVPLQIRVNVKMIVQIGTPRQSKCGTLKTLTAKEPNVGLNLKAMVIDQYTIYVNNYSNKQTNK